MPETQKESMATTPSRPPEAGALFQVLTSRKADARQVYTAIRELESMAGRGVVAELTALIRTTSTEQTAQFQAALAEVTAQIGAVDSRLNTQTETAHARFDAVEKQLGRIWAFLILILGTLLGTLTTLLTTLLPKG